MDRIETVGDVLNNLAKTLDADFLEPDDARPDWAARRVDVARLRESVRDELFGEYARRRATTPPRPRCPSSTRSRPQPRSPSSPRPTWRRGAPRPAALTTPR
jgi:hypothetical protein